MAASIGAAWRSFWHTMTSYDRHASHDSPFRTGKHVPLNQSRHAPLTSVAATTAGLDSRADLASPYADDTPLPSGQSWGHGTTPWPGPGSAPLSRTSTAGAYSPGMRSSSFQRQRTSDDALTPGEIQMQSFHDGLPPPPPVTHSWKRIGRWTEDHYPELWDQLAEGCTQNDLNELEHELDCSLPTEVRESLQCHDGQERGGRPTGIIFGCMLLDCEEIVQEWKNWRTVNEEYLTPPPASARGIQPRTSHATTSSSSSSAHHHHHHQHTHARLWRQELLDRQDSQPPKAVQKAYAHPSWIPLARDWGGNNLAVDLAPGPAGKWGQVIIFGRDYDCKYVVARSWAAFLAAVADDLGSDKAFVDEETQELKLREFKAETVEPAYLDILRWRMDQKYGRRAPPSSSAAGASSSAAAGASKKRAPNGVYSAPSPRTHSPKRSPFATPTDDRGRSPVRVNTRGQAATGAPGSNVSGARGSGPPGSNAGGARGLALGMNTTGLGAHGAAPGLPSPLSSSAQASADILGPNASAESMLGAGQPNAEPTGSSVGPSATSISASKAARPDQSGRADLNKAEKLIEVPTPDLASGNVGSDAKHDAGAWTKDKEVDKNAVQGLGVDGLEEMKNVAI